MKKPYLSLAIIAAFVVVFIVVVGSLMAVNQKNAKPIATTGIPEDVLKIFTNSCYQCHSEGGNGFAMANVNFSEWDTYPLKKQIKKANAICDVVTNGTMPPASVRQSAPEKVPTKVQVGMICDWAATVK